MANLDRLAAQHAQNIIAVTATAGHGKDDVENVVTKSLGVIQEQGVFAGLLYLLSRRDREGSIESAIRDEFVALLAEPELSGFELAYRGHVTDAQTLLNHFANTVCAKPVQTLLLVKSLFEQTLTYARYSAKARPDNVGATEDEEQAG
jgi:hypothetical protein